MKFVAHTLLWRAGNAAATLVGLATLTALSWAQSPELRNDPSRYDAGSIPLSAFSNPSSAVPLAYPPSSTITPTATGEWSQWDSRGTQQFTSQSFSNETAHGYRYRSESGRGNNHSVSLPQQEPPLFSTDPTAAGWYGEISATPYRFRKDTRLDSLTPAQTVPGYRFRPQ
ncbi:hypothetical protein HUU62_02800 [Rhodoferax sp. 4810]|uniref:Uncharacterized protein n=1 Tax=Thiospirillum jenense TaxID=1653858 RepID=A0A839HAI7_9GAMM|nr:hypothetical protein [Thiospirillum jenense]MBB1073342.1 hypothetical protein [Rhodoferax jenense]MBB1125694.1 hypothetical protein [Thiospirillum jenense]